MLLSVVKRALGEAGSGRARGDVALERADDLAYWEMAQAYRKWSLDYGDEWEAAFRERFERQMIEDYDTHFYVGTVNDHPSSWIVTGLWYPPKEQQGVLV